MKLFSKNLFLPALLAVLIIFSCKDEVLKSESSASIRQIGKCNGQGLNKTASECFEYVFREDLSIKFCVSGNCCPDSARFASDYKITEDVITINVKDIAPNLCKCICNYTVEAKFSNLNLDSYTIVCIQETSDENKVLYNKKVSR